MMLSVDAHSVTRPAYATVERIANAEFEYRHAPGLLGISRMERAHSEILGGRQVTLRTPEDLSRDFRQEVLAKAEV